MASSSAAAVKPEASLRIIGLSRNRDMVQYKWTLRSRNRKNPSLTVLGGDGRIKSWVEDDSLLLRVLAVSGALDAWDITTLEVSAPDQSIGEWPKELCPVNLRLSVKRYPVSEVFNNERLEQVDIRCSKVPREPIRVSSKKLECFNYRAGEVESAEFLSRLPRKTRVIFWYRRLEKIPWFMGRFEFAKIVNLCRGMEWGHEFKPCGRLVAILTLGLANDTNTTWSNFLKRGLYDPRIFLVLIKYLMIWVP